MKRWYRNRGISFKISFLFASLFMLMTGVLTFVLYNHFQQTVNESIMNVVSAKVTDNMRQLQSLLARIENSTNMVHDNDSLFYEDDAEIPPICKMLISYEEEPGNENVLILMEEYEANKKLFNEYYSAAFGSAGTDYSNIFFVDSSLPIEKFLPKYVDFSYGNGFRSSVNAEKTEWYQKASDMNGNVYWFLLPEYETRLCMAKLLKHTYVDPKGQIKMKEIGMLTISFDISTVYDMLDVEGITSGSELYLIDKNQRIVFSSTEESSYEQLIKELSITVNEQVQEIEHEKQQVHVYFRELPMELAVVTVVPLDDINKLTTDAIGIIFIVGFIAMCIASAVIIFLATKIVSPIKRLSVHMQAGQAELIACDKVGQDEIGKLYQEFNTLMNKLNQSMEENILAVEKKKEAELKALQAQINPHFIYNTLNSVSSLALYYEKEDIAEVVGNLSQIMRYSINDPNELVPIRNELAVIKQYENIQKSCYWEEVTFRYEIAADTLDIMIPKLIIQPLIENALIHGLDHREGCAEIRLIAKKNNNKIQIIVWDSGKEADIEKLNQYIMREDIDNVKSNSIGVRNVLERINIVFGERGNLHFEKDAEGHTMAIISIG